MGMESLGSSFFSSIINSGLPKSCGRAVHRHGVGSGRPLYSVTFPHVKLWLCGGSFGTCGALYAGFR